MGDRFKGKSAVVTGAGRGIGREIALALAEESASVVVCDLGTGRDGRGVEAGPAAEVVAIIREKGGRAAANYESVADYNAAERIIKNCLDNFGRLDILVNCAGILRERMIFNMSEEDWDAVLDVHLKGTWNCCRHACILMRQQRGGRIINTTSVAWLGTVGQCNYGSAKGGIVSLTRAIAREMGRYGVTCNAIDPAAATRMTMDARVMEGLRKRLEAGLITREYYEAAISHPGPEYVPPFVLYLASDAAANVNGQVFHAAADRVSIYSNPVETKALYKNYRKDGKFTLDELIDMVPKTLLVGYVNPAPPEPPEK